MIEQRVVRLAEFQAALREAPGKAIEAARIALNGGAKRLASESSKAIRESLAFNARELYSPANPLGGKIAVRLASNKTLEARVTGSDRPTLLSRFATNLATRRANPRVRVNPGRTKELERGFFLRFPNGTIGLAIRLKPGERIVNRRLGNAYPLKGSPGAFVLFGPSVEQALGRAAPDKLDDVEAFVNAEFDRQFVRLLRG